jgi:DNA (cytosine-5)-methyltransferase 1
MKYISICSGIEAASTAWRGLGWTPLAFSEIEPFPSAVLAQRHPNVPNLGDMSKYREWPEELLAECDLLVGGTPCQAFSVAGLRKSLDDERGNLSLIYVHLFHHINEVRKRHGRPPAIALWENVPGVLSTKDNAFGCFISGLLGVDDTIETQDGKWPKAGFLGSETVRVGYRVLDAQYFAVAQRRRRVFLVAVPCELVASLGERACPSEILSLRESVLGNPPTRGEARQVAAGCSAKCSASSGGCGEPYHLDRAMFNQGVNAQYDPQITDDGVAASMVARGPAAVMWRGGDQANSEHCIDHAGTLNCDKGQQGGIVGIPDPAYAVSAGNQSKGGVFGSGRDSQDTFVMRQSIVPAVFTKAKRAQSVNDDESWVPGEVAPTQNQFDVGDTRATTVVAFTQNSRDEVRQIDGDGQIAGALSAEGGMHQTNYLAFANRTRDGVKVPEIMKDGVVPALTNPGQGGRSDAVNVLADAPVQVQWASGGGKVENPTMQALRTSAEHSYQFIRHAMQVRRLTPTECCRLQGFPDDHCDITFRKKPAADGPKYRALGNSMAVPCMAWLGYRIQKATQAE